MAILPEEWFLLCSGQALFFYRAASVENLYFGLVFGVAMSELPHAIMDAAERRMRIGGFNGFSFRDIAADVGVKSLTVHYHFGPGRFGCCRHSSVHR